MSELRPKHFSGIAFDWVVVRELRFVDNYELVGPAPLENLQASLNVNARMTADQRSCRVQLQFALQPPPENPGLFQTISAMIEGQFSLASEEPSVDLAAFSAKQAPAILMPFLRDAIATATGKSRFGQVLIPPINIQAIVEDSAVQSAALAEQPAPAKP